MASGAQILGETPLRRAFPTTTPAFRRNFSTGDDVECSGRGRGGVGSDDGFDDGDEDDAAAAAAGEDDDEAEDDADDDDGLIPSHLRRGCSAESICLGDSGHNEILHPLRVRNLHA